MRKLLEAVVVLAAIAVLWGAQMSAALQPFQRGMVIPAWPNAVQGGPTIAGVAASTIDAVNEAWCAVVTAPSTEVIRSVWFRPGTVTTGATITIGIYAVSLTTGDPADTPVPYATNTFRTTAIATTDAGDLINSGAFTADASVVKGALFAVCFINPGATPGNMNFSTFTDVGSNLMPYHTLFTGTWAKTGAGPVLALQYDDGAVEIPGGAAIMGDTTGATLPFTNTFSTASTPDVWGARFQFPGPVSVTGAWAWLDLDGDADIYLVDAAWDGTSGGALATATFDANVRATTTANMLAVTFNTTVNLLANTWYRLVFVPTTTTNTTLYDVPVMNAAIMGALPLGVNFHTTSAKDPNDDTDWTNYDSGTFRVPYMGLVLSQIDDGVSTGGGVPYIISLLQPPWHAIKEGLGL